MWTASRIPKACLLVTSGPLLGEIEGCEPDGLVDGKAGLECGIGGYHRGPADGVPCSGISLIGDAIVALEAAAGA